MVLLPLSFHDRTKRDRKQGTKFVFCFGAETCDPIIRRVTHVCVLHFGFSDVKHTHKEAKKVEHARLAVTQFATLRYPLFFGRAGP